MADLNSYEDKLKVISYSTKWLEGVADLISYGDKLKAISLSTKCSEGLGVLIPVPYKRKFKVISH